MMTMTSPRRTSMETNREPCVGRGGVVVPTLAAAGKSIAVTTPHLCKQKSVFYSYFDRRARENRRLLRDLNKIKEKSNRTVPGARMLTPVLLNGHSRISSKPLPSLGFQSPSRTII